MAIQKRPWLAMGLLVAACGYDPGESSSAALGDGSVDGESGTVDGADATIDGASVDGAMDSTVDGSTDSASALDADASTTTDAAVDAPQSVFCGDGIRGQLEECDDGVTVAGDLCSSFCEVRESLATRAIGDAGALTLRSLGTSRHPLAAGGAGFAVAWIETQAPVQLGVSFYGPSGVPIGVDRFGVGAVATSMSAPAVAALPNGKYALFWADLAGDGDGLGVVGRIVDPQIASSGAPVRVNVSTSSSQHDVDALWTGSELVVAWTDLSVFPADVRYRTFDASLSPTSGELTLAGTSAGEGSVALTAVGSGWGAAWREISGAQETVRAKVGSFTFATPPAAVAPYDDPPALVPLDSTHLLLVYAEATGPASSKLRGAVLDTSSPGVVAPFDLPPLAQGDAGAPPSAYRPATVKVGSTVLISWATEAKLADPKLDELWVKAVTWNGASLDLSAAELPVPRWDNHRLGDQRLPALAATQLAPGGALAAAWVDMGSTLSGSATTDVAVSLLPVPILRKPNADGGGL